jgi:hypothetical protein
MTKDQINQAILALTIVGAVLCFALGKSEAGMMLMAFAGGHAVPSPLSRPVDGGGQ